VTLHRHRTGRIFRYIPPEEGFFGGGDEDDGGGDGGKPSRGTYSTARGNDYRATRDYFVAQFPGTSVSDFSYAVKEAANRWYDKNNKWPTAGQLVGWGVMAQAAANAASPAGSFLPYIFRHGGNTYMNDPLLGPTPLTGQEKMFAELVALNQSDLRVVGAQDGQPVRRRTGIPTLSSQDVQAIMGAAPRRGGGGGGRGGGAGRQAIPFDKAQLKNQAVDIWRGLLLEEPDNLDALVNDYIKRANGFWTSEGGQLDFGTFIQDRARTTPRYKTLYNKKAAWQSEGQYLSQYSNAVAGFGFNQQTALREIEAGASAGVGQAGFTARLQQGRANFLNNQGTYSQRFAQQVLQSGLAGS